MILKSRKALKHEKRVKRNLHNFEALQRKSMILNPSSVLVFYPFVRKSFSRKEIPRAGAGENHKALKQETSLGPFFAHVDLLDVEFIMILDR